ncbi:hypothetical protein HYV82_03990 [Candidatus Woesearchaeota archaeon]|nr:hypothetical protein [Candidatus Woesearchaeota archaeon]
MIRIGRIIRFAFYSLIAFLFATVEQLPARFFIAAITVIAIYAGIDILSKKFLKAPIHAAAIIIILVMMLGLKSIFLVALLFFMLMVDVFL